VIFGTSYLLACLVALSLLSLLVGVSNFSLLDIFTGTNLAAQVLIISRIPRMIAVVLTGMGMSIGGLIMQQLSRNRFVSPTTAGTTEFARLGVLVSLLAVPQASSIVKMVIVFVFAVLGAFVFFGILNRLHMRDALFVPLLGLMLGSVVSAITTLVAYGFDLVQSIGTWLMGNFAMVTRGRYELLYAAVPLVSAAYLGADKFTIAGMGKDQATSLGLNYSAVMYVGLGVAAGITAVVVASVGRIPFLGMIVPNVVALHRGDHLRSSFWTAGLFGAVFLLAADIIGRVAIAPYEIPIGLTVGIMGSAAFLYLLWRRGAA
jgi:iron complex transport system permease protein